MSTPVGNSAANASGNGPALGYSLKLWLFILFMLICVISINMFTCFILLLKVIEILLVYTFNFGIKLCPKLPKYLTIQKPDCVNRLSVSSFAASIKPPPFDGSNYKRWQERLILWLTLSRVIHVKEGKPEQFSPEEGSAFDEADILFRGLIISVLGENLVDSYIRLPTGKALWDALEAQYGVSDAGSELYIMEQFLEYRMVEDRSVVEQAHEIHTLAKDLKNCSKESPCVLPNKFVAGGIISKLPPSWRDFATSLKHKRQEFTIDGLIVTLDVEEKARTKDIRGKGVVGASSANLVQKNNSHKEQEKATAESTKD